MMEKVALSSTRIEGPAELQPALERAFTLFATARPGPVHIEIPLDVMAMPAKALRPPREQDEPAEIDRAAVMAGARLIAQALRPVILAGGGAKYANRRQANSPNGSTRRWC